MSIFLYNSSIRVSHFSYKSKKREEIMYSKNEKKQWKIIPLFFCLRLYRRRGSAEKVSLGIINSETLKNKLFFFGLDSFSDDRHSVVMRESDYCFDKTTVFWICVDSSYIAHIYLDIVWLKIEHSREI